MRKEYLKIRDFCEIFDGPHATPTKTDDGPFYLSISSLDRGTLDLNKSAHLSEQEFQKWTKRVTPRKGDLLFSYETRLGEAALMPDGIKACLGRRMGILRPDTQKILSEYLLYSYIAPEFQNVISSNTITGATVDRLSLTDFPNFEMRIPQLEQQRHIVAVLSALDAKIALNQRINGELEGMAKLLYDYWFVQFDFPLSAAQAAALGKPRLAGKPYRSSGGKMVFHPELKREIPVGWKVGSLSELCHLNHRTWPNKDHPEHVTYLDLANAKNGEILSVQNYKWNEAPSRARRILTPGDTIFGTVRPGNRSFALVPKSDEILTGSTGFAILTPKSAIYREFNYLSLTSESNINRLTTVASGAAYPAVNPEVVAAQSIAFPDADLVKQFHNTVAPFFDLIERHRAQNQELATLRDWLLPMLMNGQVTVR